MTEHEIQRFFKECDIYVRRHNIPSRAYVFPALYRFMYCCGVRSQEARMLKCEDVHLDKGYVDILWAKAHRDRMLFLSDELIQYLKDYEAAIQKVFRTENTFSLVEVVAFVHLPHYQLTFEIYGWLQG
ncbi:tyrosine-type recombinase/integrase [Bacteroides heparinolyticus]|uniref:tyrosine-type recombinase/integrase n=1 Tax=Prevotella heparinolytica TaxID=28113 RepID=UPI0035A11D24